MASPLNFTLLPLVPPGAQIVSGFENRRDSCQDGLLVLSSHYNRLDFADWQSITGVDSERRIREVIEVAAATPEGDLTEHLLLVAGRFNRERIFKSAETNAATLEFEGHRVVLIKPFAREKGDMVDTRWLVILEDRIGLLGSKDMVQKALRRYANHDDTDMVLRERLFQLPRDVSSWNVLVAERMGGRQFLMHPGSAWAPLLDDAQMLMVGARFGPKVRVVFSVHASSEHGTEFFAKKVNSFHAIFANVFRGKRRQQRLKDVEFEANRVQGSIEMSMKQFEAWGEQASLPANSHASDGE